MTKNKLSWAALLIGATFLSAYGKDEIINNYYAAPEEPKGSALGFVTLMDEFGRMSRRNDGARVTVKGSSPLIEAISDTNGRYQLDGLRAGNYVLTYERPGYGAYEQEFMLAAAGGNQPVLITTPGPYGPITRQVLAQQATTVVSNLQVTTNPAPFFSNDPVVTIDGLVSPATTDTRPRTVAIAFDTVAHVSKDNLLIGYLATPSDYSIINNQLHFVLTQGQLEQIRQYYNLFLPGQRLYVRAYGAPSGQLSGFLSRDTGLYIWSSMNPQASNRVDFVVPN